MLDAFEGDTPQSIFSFWKNMVLIMVFFAITPITLGVSLFALLTVQANEKTNLVENQTSPRGVRVYASLPNQFPSVSTHLEFADARPKLIRQYLLRYNSPLVGLEEYMVTKADEYGLDYRLIPAIAQQESNLCKIYPPQTFNCWGWGIHSRGTLGFNSYEEAIDAVMKGLKKEYIDKGLTTPDTIWKKYTPSSPDGAWAKGVNQFMSAME